MQAEKKGTSFYPIHTTDQVLSAFFDYKFDHQQDIWALIENLDDSIVDKSQPTPVAEDYLVADNLPEIVREETYSFDDIFNLSQSEFLSSVCIYREGIDVLNNGNCYPYDRTNDKSIEVLKSKFSDCVENLCRLVSNLVLFNPKTLEFDLKHICELVAKNSSPNLYFKNFLAFYAHQVPRFANVGNTTVRSLWNKVVGDLNAFDELPRISYLRTNNELEPGFINFIRVFQKVFGLSLEEFQPGKLEEEKEWVEKSLTSIFSALNPTYSYEIDLNLEKIEEELFGSALITVGTDNEDIFSFNLHQDRGHAEIDELKILKRSKATDYTSFLKSRPNSIVPGSTGESLLLLASPQLQENIHHPLYKLFTQPLFDNARLTGFLKRLIVQYKDNSYVNDHLPLAHAMVKNVFGAISWNDEEIVRRVTPVVLSMASCGAFQDATLYSGVKKLRFDGQAKPDDAKPLIKYFSGTLDFTSNYIEAPLALTEDFQNIKELIFTKAFITELTGLEHAIKLEKLCLKKTDSVKELNITGPLPNLRVLDLYQSRVTKVRGLSYAPHLVELNLKECQIGELSFSEPMEKLTQLHLGKSHITKLKGLEHLHNLEKIKLNYTHYLTQIEGLESLEKLKELNLVQAKGIKKLTFKKENKELVLKLHGSGITEKDIEGIEYLDRDKIHF